MSNVKRFTHKVVVGSFYANVVEKVEPALIITLRATQDNATISLSLSHREVEEMIAWLQKEESPLFSDPDDLAKIRVEEAYAEEAYYSRYGFEE